MHMNGFFVLIYVLIATYRSVNSCGWRGIHVVSFKGSEHLAVQGVVQIHVLRGAMLAYTSAVSSQSYGHLCSGESTITTLVNYLYKILATSAQNIRPTR